MIRQNLTVPDRFLSGTQKILDLSPSAWICSSFGPWHQSLFSFSPVHPSSPLPQPHLCHFHLIPLHRSLLPHRRLHRLLRIRPHPPLHHHLLLHHFHCCPSR